MRAILATSLSLLFSTDLFLHDGILAVLVVVMITTMVLRAVVVLIDGFRRQCIRCGVGDGDSGSV
jgi:hypothetical protein